MLSLVIREESYMNSNILHVCAQHFSYFAVLYVKRLFFHTSFSKHKTTLSRGEQQLLCFSSEMVVFQCYVGSPAKLRSLGRNHDI